MMRSKWSILEVLPYLVCAANFLGALLFLRLLKSSGSRRIALSRALAAIQAGCLVALGGWALAWKPFGAPWDVLFAAVMLTLAGGFLYLLFGLGRSSALRRIDLRFGRIEGGN